MRPAGIVADHDRRETMERAELELSILNEISRVLSAPSTSTRSSTRSCGVLAERLGMERGSMVLLDDATGKIRTEAALGLTPEEIHRGTYDLGEGITGAVVATGQARVVPDISAMTASSTAPAPAPSPPALVTSFICVPIKIENRVVGALSVDKRFIDDDTLKADQRLLEIVAAFIAQAIKINEIVAEEREEWQEENAPAGRQPPRQVQVRQHHRLRPAMLEVFATIAQVAASRATCLLLGETGTGKELIAKAIHYNSPRADKPFIRVNCGALTGTCWNRELFGHVKGSFTGAIRDKMGRFEAADGGTLFLDEIGTIDPQPAGQAAARPAGARIRARRRQRRP